MYLPVSLSAVVALLVAVAIYVIIRVSREAFLGRVGSKGKSSANGTAAVADDDNDTLLDWNRYLAYDGNGTNYTSEAFNATYNTSFYNSTNISAEEMTITPFPAPTALPTTPSPTTNRPTPRPTLDPTLPPTRNPLDGMQGALVTNDCLFENDYAYAIDIFWSCGDERFNNPLRLHTFKRHSRDHKKVFRDQLITYRNNGQLWFDAYNIPRCIRVDGEELMLTSSASACTTFEFLSTANNAYQIQDAATGRCMGLGEGVNCNSDRSTGGEECGGVDHRFLPLEMMADCNQALTFRFETEAQNCANGRTEFPENACF